MKRSQMTSLPLSQEVGSNHTTAGVSLHGPIIRHPGQRCKQCLTPVSTKPTTVVAICTVLLRRRAFACYYTEDLPGRQGSALLPTCAIHTILFCPLFIVGSLGSRSITATSATIASRLLCWVGTAAVQKPASRAPWFQWWPRKPLTVPS